jgi:negative regulator of sigma E activity
MQWSKRHCQREISDRGIQAGMATGREGARAWDRFRIHQASMRAENDVSDFEADFSESFKTAREGEDSASHQSQEREHDNYPAVKVILLSWKRDHPWVRLEPRA